MCSNVCGFVSKLNSQNFLSLSEQFAPKHFIWYFNQTHELLEQLVMSCRPTGGRKTRKYESKTTGGRVTPASYRALNMYCSGRGVVLLSLENLPGGRSQRCRTTGSCHNQPYKPLVLLISTGSRALCPALLCLRTAECQDSFVTSFFLFFSFFISISYFVLLCKHTAAHSPFST